MLPPVDLGPPPEGAPLSASLHVVVRGYRFSGNTAFSDGELAAIAAPYTNRAVSSQELEALRRALTLHYVNRGYVNSGALLPDQDLAGGIVEFRIVEGRLSEVQVEGNEQFRTGYLERRLAAGVEPPLRVDDLEQRLRLLQQDQRIQRVNAELGPGASPADGVLRVRVEEGPMYRAWLDFANEQSPAIGEYRGRLYAAHENLTGRGDPLSLMYGLTDGLDEIAASYELPLGGAGTRLELRYDYDSSDVVEDPFDSIDIESRTASYGIGLRHALRHTPGEELWLGLRAEYRESRNYLLGDRFSFSLGPENGKSQVAVLRVTQDWSRRGPSQALAVRSMFSFGIDALGATLHSGDTEDGRFASWLLQAQWARRVAPWDSELLTRLDLQLASDALLPLEQFSIGGRYSVRGYRENQIVRDHGIVGSLELRVPLIRSLEGEPVLQVAPFVDVGRGWNRDRGTPSPRTLAGAGVGLRWAVTPDAQIEFYWGGELRDVSEPTDRSSQDRGLHFRVTYRVP